MTYFQLKEFVDEVGHLIHSKERVLPAGCDPYLLEKPEYKGLFTATIATPHGPAQQKFEFAFPKDMEIEECFSRYEEFAMIEFEALKKKIDEQIKEQNRIIVPGSNKGGVIL